MRWSSSQYCSRSLPDTSARLPAETKVETPIPRLVADASTCTPSAPDWLNSASPPGAGRVGASEALSRMSSSVLITPNEFGPITRIPWARARRTSARWRRTPRASSSAKPSEITSRTRAPASAQSLTTSSTTAAGTAMTAMSTTPGTSVTRAWLVSPSTSSARGLTAWMAPRKPASSKCLRIT